MASTNIYDFTVKSVDFEGRIYLFGMDCRKPPQQRIHWKSTSRLKVSCLVAVVKVQDRNTQLKKDDRIIWAEVKQFGDPRDEFKKREGGQMVVSDLRDSKDDDENELRAGDHVVVIDCKTFVPEHIPVVKALEDLQLLSTLPFNDGALLNISVNGTTTPIDFDKEFRKLSARKRHIRRDSFGEISSSDCDYDSETDENKSYQMPSIDKLVDFMVDQSKLEPLIQIRRDAPEKDLKLLKQQLYRLMKETTLDREQLKSFIESFVEPVHLTQGPPGTGKSYLGVVIVRALIMIRQVWIKFSEHVSEMPILVLSYKNHAIDEFLVDLLKAEGEMSSLLRIGSSENPKLSRYLEKNQKSYKNDTQQYKTTLKSLYQQTTIYQQIKDDLSPLSEHQALKDSQPTSNAEVASKKKASYAAATYLCNVIARVQKIESFLEKEEQDVESDAESEDSGYSDCNITNLWNDLFPINHQNNTETGQRKTS
uniref:DNA2/NAM7 helicase helicase domain-containing protein n=2 Tax=Clytia hemisphaerica TaxID=252671 RepID=A0A7M5WTE7_9CNID